MASIATGKLAELMDACEEAISDGSLSFGPVRMKSVDPRHIGWKIAEIFEEIGFVLRQSTDIAGAVLIKTSDPYIQYFGIAIGTGKYWFATDNHHTGIHPDDAFSYLIRKLPFPDDESPFGEIEFGDN